jgi:hypothetical protein
MDVGLGSAHIGSTIRPRGPAMLIDCDACTVRGPACAGCVVTVLLRIEPAVQDTGAVELDHAEQEALAVLAGSGLVPPLRLVPPHGSPAGRRDRGRRQVG